MSSALSIQSVSKRYGHLQALDQVSFTVDQGDFFALLGPNGAGKTTLIAAMAGLLHPDAGTIRVMDCDVVREPLRARQQLGVVPQELVFDPFLTVRETLRYQSGYFGLRHNDDWIDQLLHHLALADKANSNMRALSGGMKRRVMVAQALVHKPPLIVLDEPTAGVDVELRQSLWCFVRQLNAEGHTIVLTTHYLEEAQTLCNRIAMMKKGRLIALEDKNKLLAHSSQRDVVFKLAASLPASLQGLFKPRGDNQWSLQLNEFATLEPILAQLREASVPVLDMQIIETDLEDIFVNLMSGELQ